MSAMASYLQEFPNRVVISENGPTRRDYEQFGLARAWAVLECLTEKNEIDKNRFSISTLSTLPKNGLENGRGLEGPERAIEIVLLERSIYN